HLRDNRNLLLLLFYPPPDDRENHRQVNINHINYMKSSLCSSFLKAALLIVLLALSLSGPTAAQAAGNDPWSPGPVRPGNFDYRPELPQGYLKVYSATDRFKDGDALYFPHSSYAIYTIDGRLFENVKNKRSAGDE